MADERLVAALLQQELDAAQRPYFGNPNLAAQGRKANERSRAFPFIEDNAQKPADPLESFRSLAGLRDAYERRVQPIINNARQTFSTGGAMGDLLRSYGDAAAPGNAAALKGMGIPFRGPMTAPREEGFTSGENFRPMGDPQQQFAGQLLGDPMNVQPMIAPAARGAVTAGKYAGPELARGLENYMVKSGGILPMDVYHGSPHRFPPTAKNPLGELDPTKIGTGEGAQAYGHGLYFAENPSVAESYKAPKAMGNLMMMMNDKANILSQKAFAQSGGDRAGAIALLKELEVRLPFEQRKETLDAIRGINNGSFSTNLYKVDLPDEHIAKMLDWDKPLSKQADLGQKISPESLGLTYKQLENGNHAFVNSEGKVFGNLQTNGSKESFIKNWTENVLRGSGRDLYNQLGQGMGGGAKVSEALRQAGIPGIRYLDQGSRAAPSSAQFVKADVVGAADDLTALAKSMGLDAEVRHSGSNAGKSSYVSVFDPMTNRYIKSTFRISDHGTGALRHQEHIHINSPADLVTQKNDLFEWVKRNRTEKGVDTTDLRAPSQGTSNFVVFDPAHMNIIGRE